MTLNELINEYERIMEAFIHDPEEYELAQELFEIDAAIETKADGYSVVMDRLDAEEAGFKAQKKVYSDKAKKSGAAEKACKNQRERMNANLMAAMRETGKGDGFSTGMHKYWIGGIGGKQELVYDKTFKTHLEEKEKYSSFVSGLAAIIEDAGLTSAVTIKWDDDGVSVKLDNDKVRNLIAEDEETALAHLAPRKEKVKYK